MRRLISSGSAVPAEKLEQFSGVRNSVVYPLEAAVNRAELSPVIAIGNEVASGTLIASSPNLDLHSSVSGIVETVDAGKIIIKKQTSELAAKRVGTIPDSPESLSDYAARIGLCGMGGSMFPYSIKFKACKSVTSLVINCVECEPLIEIDEALLLNNFEPIRKSIELLKQIFGLEKIIIALRQQHLKYISNALKTEDLNFLAVHDHYPGGAEKLIINKLEGIMPPAGLLPMNLGYLVMSVASMWALGNSILKSCPLIERPLTLAADGHHPRNIIVPVGTVVSDILAAYSVNYDPEKHILIAGGMMMGKTVGTDFSILKGTNALLVRDIESRFLKKEESCTRCGACYDACPLGLHPSRMMDLIKRQHDTPALRNHVNECFLCGSCSAACPSEIALVNYFKEAKQWLRK